MLVTQATEAQQKQNIFRSCPVFSAASLQWQRQTWNLYRSSLLYSATEFLMLRKNHPSSPTKRTEICSPVPFQLVPSPLVICDPWGILAAQHACTKTAFPRIEEYFPGMNRQFCRGNLHSLYH